MNNVKDLTGQRFGKLVVIKRDITAPPGRSKWICRCDCGNVVSVHRNHLIRGETTSCGCARIGVNMRDVTGKKFGRLTAIERTDRKSGNTYIYKCRCDCGKICYVSGANLRSGATTSCGCYSSEVHKQSVKTMQDDRNTYYISGTDVMSIANEKPQKNNTSGYPGVSWDRSVNIWKSYITFQGKRYYLGASTDINVAIKLRKTAEKKIFGDFLKWYAETYPKQWEKIQRKGIGN